MNWKELGKTLLFPHIAIMIILLPIAAVFLIYSLVFMGKSSVIAIVSYVLAFYTLAVWSLKTPVLIEFFKSFKNKYKYTVLWKKDESFRVSVPLYGMLIWNTAYALLQLGMGFWHRSFWFFSLAGYYISLAVMRFFLVRYTTVHKPRENLPEELVRCRLCGWILLVMNFMLALMVFFMVYWNRTFKHHKITTITLAVYTFTAFTMAVINIIRHRKVKSPVYYASEAINLASACVSMLTLEATMLTTFGKSSMNMLTRKIFLGCTGGVISVFVIILAIYMIRQSNKKLRELK